MTKKKPIFPKTFNLFGFLLKQKKNKKCQKLFWATPKIKTKLKYSSLFKMNITKPKNLFFTNFSKFKILFLSNSKAHFFMKKNQILKTLQFSKDDSLFSLKKYYLISTLKKTVPSTYKFKYKVIKLPKKLLSIHPKLNTTIKINSHSPTKTKNKHLNKNFSFTIPITSLLIKISISMPKHAYLI